MKDFVTADLAQEHPSEFHQQLLQDSRDLVAASRRRMAEYYPTWNHNDEVYKGIMTQDNKDREAAARREPIKSVIPIAYSQIQTFASFCFALYTQRERFFELIGNAEEDHKAARIGEALLERDLNKNSWKVKLYQFLVDTARYGIGVVKSGWTVEKDMRKRRVEIPTASPFTGIELPPTIQEIEEEIVRYAGNLLFNISPYRFYPDVRLPLHRFQEGEFIASEDEYTRTHLYQLQAQGEIAGVEFIPPVSRGMTEIREGSYDSKLLSQLVDDTRGSGQSMGIVLLTEVQRSIIPKKYLVNGKPLGDEEIPVKYNIWIANDSRIVKCEPLGYAHGLYTYDVGQFSPDMHCLVGPSLSDSIDQLQSVISWFINSRIASVRTVIGNKLVVDPTGVEVKDLKERSPIIRLKPEAGRSGIDRYIKQLDLQDVTTNHINDAKYLQELVQVTTGITENMLGQFTGGRRSATEARNTMSSAAARLKMIASVIFTSALEPLGRKMLSNLRDGMDAEQIVRVVGMNPLAEGSSFMSVTKGDLEGEYDFEIFDGTLPSEKGYISQALQELLVALMKAPQAAISLGMDPKAILMEQLELRGVRNPERFTLKAPDPNLLASIQQQEPATPGRQGVEETPGNDHKQVTRTFQPGANNGGTPNMGRMA